MRKKEEEIERAVWHAAATEAFDFLTVAGHEIAEMKRLTRDKITMEKYVKSSCDERKTKTSALIKMR